MIAERRARPGRQPEPGGLVPRRSGESVFCGFTLVELLVVLVMIGLLATLVFSGAGGALRKAQGVKCLATMRQMGIAVQMFAGEHDGLLPGTAHGVSWTNSLAAYLGPNFIGRCPAHPLHRSRVTYAWNDCLATNGVGIAMSACSRPALTLTVAELATSQSGEHFHFSGTRGGAARVTPNQFKAEVNVEAHGSGANYLFLDGHAEYLEWAEVQKRLAPNITTFIVP